MSANFTPNMNKTSKKEPFKFWCQKVLPLVFDDALSYYEVLCKVVNYLNNMMEDNNKLATTTEDLFNSYTLLQEYVNTYFDNLDVQNEINSKLDEMSVDGSLTTLIQPLFDAYKIQVDDTISEQSNDISVLTSRMDAFTSLKDGSTTGDAELVDIRIGYDGTTYTSAGNSVREQFSYFNNENIRFKNDFANISETTINLWQNHDVTFTKSIVLPLELISDTYVLTAKIDSTDTNNNSSRIEFLDKNKDIVNVVNRLGESVTYFAVKRDGTSDYVFTPESSVAYVKLYASNTNTASTNNVATWKKVQIEVGDTPTDYKKPYTAKDDISRERISNLEMHYKTPLYVDYLNQKVNEINGLRDNSGLSGDTFIFITDYHVQSNERHSVPMIEYLVNRCGINFVCFGGDVQNYEKTLEEANYWNAEWKKDFAPIRDKLFGVIGNHEFNTHYYLEDPITYSEDITLTYPMVYNLVCKNQEHRMGGIDEYGDYFVDNKIQKIRYIFLGCPFDAQVSDTSLTFVFESMQNAPSGYGIVIFSHAGFRRQNGELDVADQVEKIGNAMYALNNKQVYTYVEQVSNQTKTVDFTNSNGEGICIICGHVHYDANAYADTTNTIPIISTTSDAGDKEHKTYGGLERTKETYLEQAFDVIHLDRTNRKIIFKRIGAGSDRDFSY